MNRSFALSLVVALVCVACSVSFAAEPSGKVPVGETVNGEYHPDWKALVDAAIAAGKNIDLPNNAKWIAYEEDMAEINRLTTKLAMPGSATLILDDTTTWFSTGNITPNCDATILKRGPSRLTQTTQQYLFYGTIVIEDGILERANHYLTDGNRNAKIVVKAGGTFHLNYSASMGDVKITAEGTGYQGQGAIILDKNTSGSLPYLVLADDTLVVQNADGTTFTPFTYAGSGRYATRNPTLLELHGHTLTIAGTSASVGFSNTVVSDDPEGLGKIVIEGLASGSRKLLKSDGLTQIAAPIELKGDTTIASGVWSNSLAIAAGKTLTFAPSSSTTEINIGGSISGEGSVVLVGAGGGRVGLRAANTYAGTTAISGTSAFTVSLAYGASIPDFSKLTKTGGTVLAAPTYDETGALTWTSAQTLALNKSFGLSTITVDVSGLANRTDLTFTKAEVDAAYPDGGVTWGAIGSGAGGYTVEGPYASADPLRLDVSEGTVRVTGPKSETNHIASLIVQGKTTALKGGTLVLDGTTFDYGNNMIYVGRNANSDTTGLGRLIVTNATVQGNVAADYLTGEMAVGMWGNGVVEVEDGACLSNKFVLGGGGSLQGNWGVGAIYQRGGIVAPKGVGYAHENSCVGFAGNGHGYYALEGGLLEPAGGFTIAGYAFGLYTQTGGLFKNRGLTVGSCNGGVGIFSILGGKTELTDNYITISGAQCNYAITTVSGPTAEMHMKNGLIYHGSGANWAWTQYNVNDGGVFCFDTFMFYSRAADHYTARYPFTLNLNGGILRKNSVHYEPIFCGDRSTTVIHAMSKVTVYEKGVTFDTNGFNWQTHYTPIDGATDGGLASVTLTDAQKTGWIAPPVVQITGDGWGASAVALLDTRTSTITNVLVTCPGWGYTKDNTTVKLLVGNLTYGTKYTLKPEQFEIADTVPGGLTKVSDGMLTVHNTNTWAKWTRVMGGTLKAACDKAIPDGTALTLSNGGVLDLNSKQEPTFTGLDGTGGSVVNGTVHLTGDMEVSAKRFIDRVSTEVTGPVDFTAVTSVTLTDAELLDAAAEELRGLYLIKGTDLTFGATKPAILGVPTGWQLSWRPDGLRLSHPKGLAIIVR